MSTFGVALAMTVVGCASADGAVPDEPWSIPSGSSELHAVPASNLCVTSGKVDARVDRGMHVDQGGMRGVVAGDASRSVELAFRYRGPSAEARALGGGELRRQIGLKLRARDSCNLVYVMWHLGDRPGVFVSVKHNAGASTHAECGPNGYLAVEPRASAPAPEVTPGDSHVLRADLDGLRLRVSADGEVVWTGELPAEALEADGPAGVRSDNGAFDFELRTAAPAGAAACRARD
ncbi:MAG: hypothetical protein KF819_08660 [Labilithrix sp.]|nr:hypothetical protein [Labilithrix sp.]